MKVNDLINAEADHSPLGVPFGLTAARSRNGKSYRVYSDDAIEDRPIAEMTLDGYSISSIEIDDEYSGSMSAILTTLLRKVCGDFDADNKILVIHPNAVSDVSTRRFLERFGFISGRDDYLERRPGSILPYSVMT